MVDKQGKVLQYLKEHGSITQLEALDLCMATRLSGIIFRLKQQGWQITSEWETDGEIRWTRYFLPKGAKNNAV